MKLEIARYGARLFIGAITDDPSTGEAQEATDITANVYQVLPTGTLAVVGGLTDVELVAVDDSDGLYFAAPALPSGTLSTSLLVVVRATVDGNATAAMQALGNKQFVGAPGIVVTPGGVVNHEVG